MLRLLLKYADTGRCHLNDLRRDVAIRQCTSRRILELWKELENRGYGTITLPDEADPVFAIKVEELTPLLATNRFEQAPQEVEPSASPDELTYPPTNR